MHRNPVFRRFRGYIAFQPERAGARGSLPEPLRVAQLCKFQGKHRAVLMVSPGDSLCVVFRSCFSGILFHICSREHIANWRCSKFGRRMSFLIVYKLNFCVFKHYLLHKQRSLSNKCVTKCGPYPGHTFCWTFLGSREYSAFRSILFRLSLPLSLSLCLSLSLSLSLGEACFLHRCRTLCSEASAGVSNNNIDLSIYLYIYTYMHMAVSHFVWSQGNESSGIAWTVIYIYMY